MKIVGCLVWLGVSLHSAFGAAPIEMRDKQPVEIERGFLGAKFRQEGEVVKPGSMYAVLERYPESKDAAAAAKIWMATGMVFGGVGGFLVGYTAVQPVFGKDLNVPVFLAGLGSVGISLGIGKFANGKLIRAVEAFNGSQGKASLDWSLPPGGAGLRLSYRFGG